MENTTESEKEEDRTIGIMEQDRDQSIDIKYVQYTNICGLKTQKKILETKYHEKEIKYQQQLQQQTKLIST